ncbi:hypothetical protein C7212DRAFT_274575, partial [Tuber magnatum]
MLDFGVAKMQLIVFRYNRPTLFYARSGVLTFVFNQSLRLYSDWISDWTSNFSPHNMRMALRWGRPIEIDTFSIFIRKLNPHTTDSELRARFSAHGSIVDCNLVKRPSRQGINAFAFIRYETEEMADIALAAESGSEFMGKKLYVQKREIHRQPQPIGVPAGHRSRRET